jgi:hypothetical protein
LQQWRANTKGNGPTNACWLLLDLDAWFPKFDVQTAGEEGPIALKLYATCDL